MVKSVSKKMPKKIIFFNPPIYTFPKFRHFFRKLSARIQKPKTPTCKNKIPNQNARLHKNQQNYQKKMVIYFHKSAHRTQFQLQSWFRNNNILIKYFILIYIYFLNQINLFKNIYIYI